MRDWAKNLLSPRARERVSGAPTSMNGASSSYLWWNLRYGKRLTGLSITLEVARRPDLDHLVIFGLQAAFIKPGVGSCKLGLQHDPRFPDRGAVNWAGYNVDRDELEGTPPLLPSAIDDVATRDYPWREGTRYRIAIERGEERLDGWFPWTGSVTDRDTGERTVVREIVSASPYLRAPVTFVTSYAPCDGPPVEARWSDPTAVSVGGGLKDVRSMRVDYQRYVAGGCSNTDSSVDRSTFIQRTGRSRTTRPGRTIRIG